MQKNPSFLRSNQTSLVSLFFMSANRPQRKTLARVLIEMCGPPWACPIVIVANKVTIEAHSCVNLRGIA